MKKCLLIYLVLLFSLIDSIAAQTSLKDAFKGRFLVGVALNKSWFSEVNPIQDGLVQNQFNSISPENVLKWDSIEPKEGVCKFEEADRYVKFGNQNDLFTIGHTLVWHSQTPDWVFKDDKGNLVSRETLLKRMRNHILTVVGRYRGRIKGWDVVNEVLADDGTLRDSLWRKIIGDDYIEKAFEFAHEADSNAELYYNDYGIEEGAKREGALKLVQKLKSEGIPITAVGIQEHVGLAYPSLQNLDKAITSFGNLGLKVMITELDVDVLPSSRQSLNADVNRHESEDASLNPFVKGLPEEMEKKLADRYADLFRVYLKHAGIISRVTFWGVIDSDSWLNNWPIRGRTSYPLLFDRSGRPKMAFYSIIKEANSVSK